MKYQKVALTVLMALLGAAPTFAAPVTFNTALPISEGEAITRLVAGYDEASLGGTTFTAHSYTAVGVYGISPRLAVFGIVPFSTKRLEMPGGARSSSGFSDARFFARYSIYQRDGPGRTFRIAPFLGFEAPTGDDNVRDSLGRLPQPLQLGSGGWDTFGGVVATYATTRMNLDGQISYRHNGEANGFQAGSAARLEVSYQRRITVAAWDRDNPVFVYAGIEGAAVTMGEAEVLSVTNPNSGGQFLVAGPTFQLAARRWIADVALLVPIAQSMNGTGLEKDFSVRAGLRVNF